MPNLEHTLYSHIADMYNHNHQHNRSTQGTIISHQVFGPHKEPITLWHIYIYTHTHSTLAA